MVVLTCVVLVHRIRAFQRADEIVDSADSHARRQYLGGFAFAGSIRTVPIASFTAPVATSRFPSALPGNISVVIGDTEISSLGSARLSYPTPQSIGTIRGLFFFPYPSLALSSEPFSPLYWQIIGLRICLRNQGRT
jgi:hypothetical protein